MELKSLSIGYRDSKHSKVIQSHINAHLKAGELTCLLGPNGSGKSTLLRTIGGFINPLEGDIIVNGKSITNISKEKLSKLVSIVLTERPHVQSMTVEQMVATGRSPFTSYWGKLNHEDSVMIDYAIEVCNIENLRKRKFNTLSDGEAQKVMIAKSIAQSTPVILLDEPTAFLDFPSKVDTMRLLSRLAHQKGKAILQSTHDINMALAMADTLWLMDKKIEFCIGSPKELAENGTLENYFSGDGIKFDKQKISFEIELDRF